eukprot:scaffold3786_cov336-Prasinococcus_capsulatus_cf.AAC.3
MPSRRGISRPARNTDSTIILQDYKYPWSPHLRCTQTAILGSSRAVYAGIEYLCDTITFPAVLTSAAGVSDSSLLMRSIGPSPSKSTDCTFAAQPVQPCHADGTFLVSVV